MLGVLWPFTRHILVHSVDVFRNVLMQHTTDCRSNGDVALCGVGWAGIQLMHMIVQNHWRSLVNMHFSLSAFQIQSSCYERYWWEHTEGSNVLKIILFVIVSTYILFRFMNTTQIQRTFYTQNWTKKQNFSQLALKYISALCFLRFLCELVAYSVGPLTFILRLMMDRRSLLMHILFNEQFSNVFND